MYVKLLLCCAYCSRVERLGFDENFVDITEHCERAMNTEQWVTHKGCRPTKKKFEIENEPAEVVYPSSVKMLSLSSFAMCVPTTRARSGISSPTTCVLALGVNV